MSCVNKGVVKEKKETTTEFLFYLFFLTFSLAELKKPQIEELELGVGVLSPSSMVSAGAGCFSGCLQFHK